MSEKRVMTFLAILITVIIAVSTFVFWRNENTEFVYYNMLFVILFVMFLFANRRLKFRIPVIASLGVVMLMHLSGGLVYIGGTRLYDIPLGPIHYDNLLHLAMGIVFAFISLNLFHRVHSWRDSHPGAFFSFIVLVTLGFGALVEIAEFIGVAFLGAPGVGDYANNARDLVFDMLGAIVGATIMLVWKNGRK